MYMLKNTTLMMIFLMLSPLTLGANISNENKISMLLGLINYPVMRSDDIKEIKDLVAVFDCKKPYVEEIFKEYATGLKNVKSDFNYKEVKNKKVLYSNSLSILLHSHLIFDEYKGSKQKKYKDSLIEEGYISPYEIKNENKKYFLMGMYLSKSSRVFNEEINIERSMILTGPRVMIDLFEEDMSRSGFLVRDVKMKKVDGEVYNAKIKYVLTESILKEILEKFKKYNSSNLRC